MSRLILIASAILLAPSAMAQTPDHSDHSSHAGQPATTQAEPPKAPRPQDDSSVHTGRADSQQPAEHGGHATGHGAEHMSHDASAQPAAADHSGHAMKSALGDYDMSRDASGTAWRPAAAPHHMVMSEAGDWMLMAHGNIDFVYTSQNGPRGDDKGFVAGMLMGTAQRRFDDGSALQFRGAISPDPLMGKRGYPLLLAAGETADGVETLVDRQHPHDLFMELSASYSRQLGQGQSVFVYAGLPGEPAFGPPACRASPPSGRRPSCIAPPPSRTRKRRSPTTGSTRRTSRMAC